MSAQHSLAQQHGSRDARCMDLILKLVFASEKQIRMSVRSSKQAALNACHACEQKYS